MTQASGSSQWLHRRHGAGRNWKLSRKGPRGPRNPPTLSDKKYVLSFSQSASKLASWFYPRYWLGNWLGFSLGFQIFISGSNGSAAPEFKTCVKTWVWQHTPITLHSRGGGRSFMRSSQPELHGEFQACLGYRVRPYLYPCHVKNFRCIKWKFKLYYLHCCVMSGTACLPIAPIHLLEL